MPAPLRGDARNDALNGYPVYLGTLDVSNTSKNNHTASTTFNDSGDALGGKVLMIQNSGTISVRILPVATNAGTVTNTRGAGFGPEIQAGERVFITMGQTYPYLAAIATSATSCNVDVFEMI